MMIKRLSPRIESQLFMLVYAMKSKADNVFDDTFT